MNSDELHVLREDLRKRVEPLVEIAGNLSRGSMPVDQRIQIGRETLSKIDDVLEIARPFDDVVACLEEVRDDVRRDVENFESARARFA